VRGLSRQRFEQRDSTITSVLAATGSVRHEDAGRGSGRRSIRFVVEAPGIGLDILARFKYEEWYERERAGWTLVRYHYDYWDHARGGRLGYHWHRVDLRDPVYHAHCEEPGSPRGHPHYRFYELGLLEAHAAFVRLYASEQAVDCSALHPLARAKAAAV
jgi:hypothetical protein